MFRGVALGPTNVPTATTPTSPSTTNLTVSKPQILETRKERAEEHCVKKELYTFPHGTQALCWGIDDLPSSLVGTSRSPSKTTFGLLLDLI